LPNAALLGGFAALAGRVSLPAVVAAINEKFAPKIAAANAAAATEAYEFVQRAMRKESAGAEAG
ncbi:MAG: 2-oxoacid:acceptor oxidoreductase family protein, partial [Steroidobacteraceae bacterium]